MRAWCRVRNARSALTKYWTTASTVRAIDVVTDQTSAHDPLSYLPVGVAFEDWHDAAARDPAGFTKDANLPGGMLRWRGEGHTVDGGSS